MVTGYFKITADNETQARVRFFDMFKMFGDFGMEKAIYDYAGSFDVSITDIIPTAEYEYDVHFRLRTYHMDLLEGSKELNRMENILLTGLTPIEE